jgi:hypothetical protein
VAERATRLAAGTVTRCLGGMKIRRRCSKISLEGNSPQRHRGDTGTVKPDFALSISISGDPSVPLW